MKIISNRGLKDYYDYVAGIYGIDDKVVYDRRDGTLLTSVNCASPFSVYLTTDVNAFDKPKRVPSSRWEIREADEDGLISNYCHCTLEVGFMEYYFEISRFLDDDGKVNLEWRLVTKHYSRDRLGDAPMSLLRTKTYEWWTSLYGDKVRDSYLKQLENDPSESQRPWSVDKEPVIANPILVGTQITSIIPPEEIFQYLSEYISSLNDKEINDNRTDVEKALSHGFDKKTSFRNVK